MTQLLSNEELNLLLPKELEAYEALLKRQIHEQEVAKATSSPLDLAELMFSETRRWPHLELLNTYLVALCEYRLTAHGPVSQDRVRWWYRKEGQKRRKFTNDPHAIPEVVAAYGAEDKSSGAAIVFRLSISMRPRAGKSRLVTEVFPFYLQLLAGGNLEIGVGTYSDMFAADWGGQARDFALLFNEEHSWFPKPAGGFRSAKDVFQIEGAKGRIRYVGVGGGITGKTLQALIGDDFIKNDDEAQSEATRLRSHRFYDRTWKTRKTRDLSPNARFPFPIEVLMATRWHQDDVTGHACYEEETREPRDDWCILNIPALSKGPEEDPLHRPTGEAHPNAAGETREDMERLREDDPRGFSALYQGEPSPEEGGLIPTTFGTFWPSNDGEWLMWFEGNQGRKGDEFLYKDSETQAAIASCHKDDLVYFAVADMAATEKTSADWTVVFACAYSREFRKLLLLDRYRGRITTDKYVEEIWPFLESNNSRTLLVEEVTYGQKFADEVRRLRRDGKTTITVNDELPRMQDKVARALSSGLPTMIRHGEVLIAKGSRWREELVSEAGAFPFGQFDDQVDALSFAAWYASELPAHVKARERKPFLSLAEEIDKQVDKQVRRNNYKRHDPWTNVAKVW